MTVIRQKYVKSRLLLGNTARIALPHSATGWYLRLDHDDGHIELYPTPEPAKKRKFDNHPSGMNPDPSKRKGHKRKRVLEND